VRTVNDRALRIHPRTLDFPPTAFADKCIAFAEREGIGRDRFELQMLYGVRPGLQLDLARRGYKVLVATPFGPEWYPYLMRRLAERPANLGFFARNLLRR